MPQLPQRWTAFPTPNWTAWPRWALTGSGSSASGRLVQKRSEFHAATGFYKIARYPLGDFFGPVDLGLHLAGKFNSLNFGVGLLAGSILPGSNRLIFSGFSTCWGGFYVSTMGGAGYGDRKLLVIAATCNGGPACVGHAFWRLLAGWRLFGVVAC